MSAKKPTQDQDDGPATTLRGDFKVKFVIVETLTDLSNVELETFVRNAFHSENVLRAEPDGPEVVIEQITVNKAKEDRAVDKAKSTKRGRG